MTYKATLNDFITVATCMADGIAAKRIADEIGISYPCFVKHFRSTVDGYTFKRKKKAEKTPYTKGTNVDRSRDSDICDRYRRGETLAAIGKVYGVSRERIRQILSRYGMNRHSGGQLVASFINHSAELKDRRETDDEKCLNKHGCTKEQWQSLRDMDDDYHKTPLGAYLSQRKNASLRGIDWGFTLWEWWEVWHSSGKYHLRGVGKGKYVMARIGDVGGYQKDNVEIIEHCQNIKDYYAVHKDEWLEKLTKGLANKKNNKENSQGSPNSEQQLAARG